MYRYKLGRKDCALYEFHQSILSGLEVFSKLLSPNSGQVSTSQDTLSEDPKVARVYHMLHIIATMHHAIIIALLINTAFTSTIVHTLG